MKGSLFNVKVWMKLLVKKSTPCYGNKNRNRNFYKELIQKAGAETELVYMKASKELLQKRLYKKDETKEADYLEKAWTVHESKCLL